MTTIMLKRVWKLGNALASGGFAEVFLAEADDGSAAVVKLIPKAPGASRELLFESLSGVTNVVPILDSGEWDGRYVLVMPRAEKSLRERLREMGGKVSTDEALAILTDIAEALVSLTARVVHRDLKPENVLLYEGRWCLADFGIARYAEATTAPDTRKFAMTPPYAAPEQWRGERATSATDVYAFGVISYELIEGRLPFPGPDDPDFREQHLNHVPPSTSSCPLSVASLVAECLFKASAARPTPTNILARLRACQKTPSAAEARLQAVNKGVVERQGQEAARVSAQQSREEARQELFGAAKQSFDRILDTLRERVLDAAPAINVSTTRGVVFRLGEGGLVVDPVQAAPADCLAAFDYDPPFDVVAYSGIAARKPRDRYDYEGRAHSLWFCDAHDEGAYRWYELAFMVRPSMPERFTLDPFPLPPTDEYAGRALTPVMDVRQLAWQPLPFDQGSEDQFIERWIGWFAAAADGTLSRPAYMPEKSGGRFRPPRHRAQ